MAKGSEFDKVSRSLDSPTSDCFPPSPRGESAHSSYVAAVLSFDNEADHYADDECPSHAGRNLLGDVDLSSSEDERHRADVKKKVKRRSAPHPLNSAQNGCSSATENLYSRDVDDIDYWDDILAVPPTNVASDNHLKQVNDVQLPSSIKCSPRRRKLQISNSLSSCSGGEDEKEDETQRDRKAMAVDGLLFEIYERHHSREHSKFVDSDLTECSTTSVSSVYIVSSIENDDRLLLDRNYLETKEVPELEKMSRELRRGITMLSSKLVRLLKLRDRLAHKLQENFNVMTALLQAISQKRRVDTRIRFSFIPRPGKRGFRQWLDALKSINRINPGIPPTWRKRTWLSLAEYFLQDKDWDATKRNCFNDRRNPDDDQLDTQIVKDLYRTGCAWFFEHDTAEDRASLKRVLLGYARWNKSVGYCQGFNVIAALILQVMDGNEEEALKVMIFVVDFVLPRNYFANNLRALSVDMAVMRDLMVMKLPYLAEQLQRLQLEAMDSKNTAASYEPPLINMFTMQWFLTLFATCLPRQTVLRIWDVTLLEGSEVLLRVALAVWAKLGDYLDDVDSAASFYMRMGELIQKMMDEEFISHQKLIQTVYQMAMFPWPEIAELREKYTYNIHPFTTFNIDKAGTAGPTLKMVSDEEDLIPDSDDDVMAGCLGFLPAATGSSAGSSDGSPTKRSGRAEQQVLAKPASRKSTVITEATPGAFQADNEAQMAYEVLMRKKELQRESEKMDLGKLRSQYARMRRLQNKAMLVFNTAQADEGHSIARNSPSAINHLFVDVSKVRSTRTRRRHNYPALKAPSKGVSSLKIKEDASRNEAGSPERPSRVERGRARQVTPLNSGVAVELRALEDISESQYERTDGTSSYRQEESVRVPRAQSPLERANGKANSIDERQKSVLYQVDKKAMYPTNFRPFPRRTLQPKSRLLQSRT